MLRRLKPVAIFCSTVGFGSKSPVEPLKFDNFENGSAGDYLLAHDPLWQSYQGDAQGLAIAQAHISFDRHAGQGGTGRTFELAAGRSAAQYAAGAGHAGHQEAGLKAPFSCGFRSM